MAATSSVLAMEKIEGKHMMDRVSVESLNIQATYSLKAGKSIDDECSLCRTNLLAPSLEDLQKGNLKIVNILGACNHTFHKTCIDAHCKENASCPVDKTPWNIGRVIHVPDVIRRGDDVTNTQFS
ncbi:MAG: hypothetical protein Harvfovirus33_10 [Harvfovirus sp.]|uniref:RING-type domain-containing protein n=1 Tax=Harvfovirus sp. TaxID=2487768 RepID=A0A3G5A2J4_9VIRU|nr:MAG: hypothetical protein Harvfovirus33_10 [Harvfovirus sp.]